VTVRVLIVDDSALVRTILTRVLEKHDGLQVVGSAPDPFVARDMIVELSPDVLVLDLEMPRMDGLSFLRRLMHHFPLPVIIFSSLTQAGSELALTALSAGAVDVLAKPGAAYSVGDVAEELAERILAAARVNVRRQLARPADATAPTRLAPLSHTTNQILAIGASTGGTVAIETILRQLPVGTPGTVVTQHMPALFTKSFAQRLDSLCALEVREAADGDSVVSGVVLIAPGDHHLLLRRDGARYTVAVKVGPPINRHRPSVDVMFRSVAKTAGSNALGVILTGMGADGAKGMLEMHEAGARTLAQDESSSVVFGMPKVAIELGGVDEVLSLERIAPRIVELVKQRPAMTAHLGPHLVE
jgi:two-component system, chemotaxis family, protein-glutamate methylesterase/glutaminase